VFARVLAIGISIGEEAILGYNPMTEALATLMPKDGLQLVALIAISLVMVGPCEELAFRGFIQKGFANSFGNAKGLLIASLLFTVIHGFNYSLVYVFPVALVFSYVWQRTNGNTSASALVHGIYNSIGIALTYFAII
jgi:membrane protease YdiL (CAAX protease family)